MDDCSKLIEPVASREYGHGATAAAMSQAISLRRIADALETIAGAAVAQPLPPPMPEPKPRGRAR